MSLVGAAALVVFFTHSIAGPVHRLRSLANQISAGDLTVVAKFRKGDVLKELSQIIQIITQGFGLRLSKLSATASRLRQLQQTIGEIGSPSREDFLKIKESLASISSELEKELNQFKF